MKKRILLIVIALLMLTLTFVACDEAKDPNNGKTEEPVDIIKVSATTETIDIKDELIADYDFAALFSISRNGEQVEVLDSYLNISALSPTPGSYDITCTYEGESATITVTVLATVYSLECEIEEIRLNQSLSSTYDFKALFTLTKDGVAIDITDDMIVNNVLDEVGTYYYTVNAGGQSKVLTVHITDEHLIEIIPAFTTIEIPQNELSAYDFVSLFAVYIDGTAIEVTPDMLDTTFVADAVIDTTYDLKITVSKGLTKTSKTMQIAVVNNEDVILTASNIVTYPNSAYIDPTKLFTITKGNENIPVTANMLTGSIDYSKEGSSKITLNYLDKSAEATVEVKRGVIITYSKSDRIVIVQGTDQEKYSFTSDFIVLVNGIRFKDFDSYIDRSDVDFSTAGEYTAKLKIPYNKDTLSMAVRFEYFESEITYSVLSTKCEVVLAQDVVKMPMGTKEYNVYSNITVTINSKKQALTEDKTHVDLISCYVQTLSDPIDFQSTEKQEVRIAVYAYGVDNDPIIVTYYVEFTNDVAITAKNVILFNGDTYYARDLFTITNGQTKVEVTDDMLKGALNIFKEGVYRITAEYLGVSSTATVVVYSNDIKGVYHTSQKTIAQIVTEDDVDEEGYPLGSSSSAVKLTDMIIDEDGKITVHGNSVEVLSGIDEHTMLVKIGTYEHTLYFNNGIAVYDPDNHLKLSFNDNKRPLVYFHEDYWTIESGLEINSSSAHVLSLSQICYTIDATEITSKDGKTSWYALHTYLISKSSGDTVYTVTWGDAVMSDDFVAQSGSVGTLTYAGKEYLFTMSSRNVGKITVQEEEKKYANITFNGTYDGKSATLSANAYENFSFYVDAATIFSFSSYDTNNMKNGGVDYANNTLQVYTVTKNVDDPILSYKFSLDTSNRTFTYIPKDNYYGKYISGNRYIFLDGYGTGIISFDTSSYYTTSFEYSVSNGIVTITYTNTDVNFTMGTYAIAHFDTLQNILTADYFQDTSLIGLNFVNRFVTDGAIVNISSYKIGAESATLAKPKLLANIEITTKDGVVSAADKESYIDTSKIRFATAGFYQLIINVPLGGKTVSSYYAVQVLAPSYTNNPLAQSYGQGVMYPKNSLNIDKYGQVTFVVEETRYYGQALIYEDSFIINAETLKGDSLVTLTGTRLVDGVIQVRSTGAVTFTDYYTTGTDYVAGTSGLVLRRISVNNVDTYILSSGDTLVGNLVSITQLDSATVTSNIYSIHDGVKEYIVKVTSWNNSKTGLTLSDGTRGTYTLTDNPTVVLDGFGTAKYGTVSATYTINGNAIVLVTNDTTRVIRLVDDAYEIVDIALDNTLVEGKTFTATYNFYVEFESFAATTVFTFGANGTLTITSQSSEYNDEYGAYKPDFVTSDSVQATYSVSGNKLSITVSGNTLVFLIKNVLNCNEITCLSTTFEDDILGYIGVNTVFDAR